MKYLDKKVSEFLDDLGSRSPVPGGGSAAALVGALGASLLSMVTHFTLGKKGYEKVDKEMKKLLFESYRLRERLGRLVDEDIERYLEVTRAQRLFKRLTKKESKKKVLEEPLRKALASSLAICKVSHQGLLLSKQLAQKGNRGLLSDAKIASLFFFSSFHAAYFTSFANARSLDKKIFLKTKRILSPLKNSAQREIKGMLSN
ncbi:MAG: cyclodeaminase/cyclohydrolase family protein [Candidatus Omnitrophica bacterium]|nr:cyclodeaminase/cyclohydrolase family protein [Candidatus Omnitrophota bacterium]